MFISPFDFLQQVPQGANVGVIRKADIYQYHDEVTGEDKACFITEPPAFVPPPPPPNQAVVDFETKFNIVDFREV